ncbi:MAG: hypothetical protein HRU15_00550, partial [Planctomycetes bacterium]|nr:hypothetical protein [Planctomycetota bacterium]
TQKLNSGSYKRQSTGTFNVGSAQTGRVRRSTTGSFNTEADTQENKQAPQHSQPTHQKPQALPPIQDPFQQNAGQAAPALPPAPPPPINTTARIRRSTTGNLEAPAPQQQPSAPPPQAPPQQQPPAAAPIPQAAPATYQVACAHCQQAFLVQSHPQEYNAACAHCGGLNRIVPQG